MLEGLKIEARRRPLDTIRQRRITRGPATGEVFFYSNAALFMSVLPSVPPALRSCGQASVLGLRASSLLYTPLSALSSVIL
jgi:hypothetical protein